MPLLTALLGAVFGAMFGGMDAGFLGLVAGALLGWQWARVRDLSRRLGEQEARLRVMQSIQSAGARAAASAAVQDAVVPAPGAVGSAPPQRADAAQAAAAETPATTAAMRTQAVESVVEPPPQRSVAGDDGARPSEMPTAGQRPEPAAARVGAGAAKAPPQVVSSDYFQDTIPAGPSPLERGVQRVRDWFFRGNVPVKIGMLVLLFGAAAALKYSVDAGWVSLPLPLRLALIAAGGLAAVLWGWRSRQVRPAFGLSLQGGGIGILLLTTFAAYRLYGLLPSGTAFALVLVLVAGAALLAVLQDAVALAVLGFLGGYLAPVLLSTGEGSHVALFSYYAVLNLAVFAIAWVKHWRALNLIGFVFTFLIGLAWGARYYRPEHFASVEPFLILFFLFYVAIVVLHALRAPERLHGAIDGPILFGTPLLAFGLQAAMLHDQPMVLAWSALAVAALYAGLASWMLRLQRVVMLGQSFAVLAVGFATLAIPLAFSARATATTWALEGAALIWLGLRQRRALPQISGGMLQILAAAAWFVSLYHGGIDPSPGEWPVLNGHALGVLLLAIAAFATSWLYERAGAHRLLVWAPFLLGTAWWGLGGLREVAAFDGELTLVSMKLGWTRLWLLFCIITLLVMGLLRLALRWPRLGWNVLLALASSLALALLAERETRLALRWPEALPWIGWMIAALVALACLRTPLQRGLAVAHHLFFATFALVYGLALAQLGHNAGVGEDWLFALGLLPLLALALLTWRAPALGAFPLAREFPAYATIWFSLVGIFLLGAFVQSLTLSGDTAPLRFVPLLNPAELLQALGLVMAAHWLRQHAPGQVAVLVAIGAFVVISLAGLRAVHHYADLPWDLSILNHGVAQTTLTVLWSIAGVSAWVAGSRRRSWGLWLAGAIGMGLVLLKLIAVDRQYVGNLAGIVSFMVVGLLLVLVGRIAPTPPRGDAAGEVE